MVTLHDIATFERSKWAMAPGLWPRLRATTLSPQIIHPTDAIVHVHLAGICGRCATLN